MPPLGTHMTLAREIAGELSSRSIESEYGAYYLGASAPDIRAMTRCDRVETHFFDLSCFDEQSGVAGLFRDHPDVADARRLDASTVAFLCGYISHLEMDEAWIMDVYRPCFGERSALKGDLLANVLDRVLQHELDRRGYEEGATLEAIRNELLNASLGVTAGLFDSDTLARWRDVVCDMFSRPWDWERFQRFASRHLKAYGVESDEDLGHFLRNVPDLLDQSIRHVTPERIDAFQQRSRERALAAIREYLS